MTKLKVRRLKLKRLKVRGSVLYFYQKKKKTIQYVSPTLFTWVGIKSSLSLEYLSFNKLNINY